MSKQKSKVYFTKTITPEKMIEMYNKLDIKLNNVDIDLINNIPNYTEKAGFINSKFFKEIKALNPYQKLSQLKNLNLDPISELEKEVAFLKGRYKSLITNLTTDIMGANKDIILIRLTFQKVFFYLNVLHSKEKKVKMIRFLNDEIDRNDQVIKQIEENKKNFLSFVEKELGEVKEKMREVEDEKE